MRIEQTDLPPEIQRYLNKQTIHKAVKKNKTTIVVYVNKEQQRWKKISAGWCLL